MHLQFPELGNASALPADLCVLLLGLAWFSPAPEGPAWLLLCCRCSRAAASGSEAETDP